MGGSLAHKGAFVTREFDTSGSAALLPPYMLYILALGALGAAVVALIAAERHRRRIACADSYDEGRVAGAIAGARAYAQGFAVPGRSAE